MFLVPLSPFSAAGRRSSELSRLFDETFDRLVNGANSANGAHESVSPALDVSDSKTAWTVKLDMPGVAKEDVKVSINGPQVNIEAEVRKDDDRKEGDRIVWRERSVSRYARSFTLPADVDQAASNARLDNGVLTLTLGKKLVTGAAQLAIN
jgi:HSP20 family protein